MYGRGGGSIITSSIVSGGGAVALPNTGGNTLAEILAYTAISTGLVALISQLAVRVLRRVYA